jgi:LuxR family maltose regulon positive regulatory protein
VPSDFVPRPRLVDRLERGRNRPLSLVCGPAGYGKSTLLSSWLESSEAVGAWLSLDERDDDLRTFLSYFIAAVRKAAPSACPKTSELVRAPELPPLQVLTGQLINELDEIDRSLILVLDDYHFVRAEAVHDLVGAILAQPPRGFHLAITSRHDPPVALAALRAKGSITEIRANQLRFDDAESVTFLGKAIEPVVDRSAVDQLVQRAEGWVAGLRLAALSVRDEDDVTRLLSGIRGTNQYVMDYLVSEVIDHQSPEVQEYLVTTSVLDRFCGALCEAVVGRGNEPKPTVSGEEFVGWVAHNNLFVVPADGEQGQWFRYHHLFRKLLQHQLENRLDQNEVARIHMHASTWFDENGCFEDALSHALAAGDANAAAGVVARRRNELMNREQWDLLHRLFARLPPDVIAGDPGLLIQAAWNAENRVRLEEMMERHEQAEGLLGDGQHRQSADLAGELAALGSARSYYSADAGRARDLAQQAMDTLLPDSLSTRGFAVGVLALAQQMSGDYSAATSLVARELQDEALHGTTYHARLLICLAMCQWCEGDLTGVLRTAKRLQVLGNEFDLVQTRFFAGYFRGIAHYHRNELDAAEDALTSVVERAYAVDRNNFTHSAFALALTHVAHGRHEEAERMAEVAVTRSMESHNAMLLRYAEAFVAELALRQGRTAEAAQWAAAFDADPILPGLRFYVPQLTLVKLLLAQDTPKSRRHARDLLTRLERYYTDTHNTRVLTDVLSWCAVLEEKEDNRDAALLKLECAVVAGTRGGFVRPFVELGSEFMELLGRLDLDSDVASHVGKIQATYNDERLGVVGTPVDPAVLRTPPSGSQPLINPLSSRELDVLTLLAQRLSNKEIAAKLHITPTTVKRHTVSVYQKLSVHGRRDAVAKASSLGMLQHPG